MRDVPADWRAVLLEQGVPEERIENALTVARRLTATAGALPGDPQSAAVPVAITATLLSLRDEGR